MSHEALADRWIGLANGRNATASKTVFADDVTVTDPALPEPIRGLEAWTQNAESGWWRAFPDLVFEKLSFTEAGDSFSMELMLKGTHLGPLTTAQGELPASRRSFAVPAAAFWRVNGTGKITEERRYYDLMGFMRQLGAV